MAMNPGLPAWRDCNVWIIGASTGIGAATARALLAAGARVALSARSPQTLAEVANDNARSLLVPLDFTDSTAVRKAWNSLVASWSRVDLVLLVAGTHQEMRAWELDEARAMALLKTNLHGVIASCSVIVPGLLEQGSGADRQLKVFRETRSLKAVVDYMALETRAGLHNGERVLTSRGRRILGKEQDHLLYRSGANG